MAPSEGEEWTMAQLRKDQEKAVNIGCLVKWKDDGMERLGWSEILYKWPFFSALWSQ